ncbi:sn-glycerol-3-phosphate import ATP-binding protein UgpC [Corynebacterium ciconiae DSM 44920]|uniref:ABC transporter ATP-binding protein n=1 Tax=Corynebacterium ciconiae TaxID=227319 RepID=UPI0003759921|nr:ATP-binding cassette domain-containing protein [Corynebacterium ciconiae]WKD61820.1 sn-glycerol-3-phosphate import ATP-binding protein UgpC [Corynebacterium ciconiae DSM 44920]
MASVRFHDVSITYPGATRPSVNHLDLEIADGEFLVLVGPSGCGKSTTLRALAGLEATSSGSIFIGETDVTTMDPAERDIAMVFQNYALYPTMTVRENMGFSLKLAKKSKADITERVERAARVLDLDGLLDRRPKDLSGGQRQRVAMGRAIVREPQVFLMDEPLSNLDAKLRVQTRSQLSSLQRELGTTTVYVTHDQVEAMTMADRVAVLNEGQLQQVASPQELYSNPANAFVAGFIGSPSMNLIEVSDAQHGRVLLGVRPENVHVADPDAPRTGRWAPVEIVVDLVEALGSTSYLYGHLPASPEVRLAVRHDGRPLERGSTLTVEMDLSQAHYFDVETGVRVT